MWFNQNKMVVKVNSTYMIVDFTHKNNIVIYDVEWHWLEINLID